MQSLNEIISENLKKIRKEKHLSLDKIAQLSGVSKSMLSQIEKCEVNPTISTLKKITNGLKISFTSLMERQESDIELVKKSDVDHFIEDDGKYVSYPIFPFDSKRRFEIFMIEIEEGGNLDSNAELPGTQEFITVFSGEVTIKINGEDYTVCSGNSIRFKADVSHIYRNSGKGIAKMSMVVYYV
ncbi:helix-turn-helix domain-containing protein [Clostridioides difficile]|nr:helix-turn-helix domain-containing protein [Clostridioides difficile]